MEKNDVLRRASPKHLASIAESLLLSNLFISSCLKRASQGSGTRLYSDAMSEKGRGEIWKKDESDRWQSLYLELVKLAFIPRQLTRPT